MLWIRTEQSKSALIRNLYWLLLAWNSCWFFKGFCLAVVTFKFQYWIGILFLLPLLLLTLLGLWGLRWSSIDSQICAIIILIIANNLHDINFGKLVSWLFSLVEGKTKSNSSKNSNNNRLNRLIKIRKAIFFCCWWWTYVLWNVEILWMAKNKKWFALLMF